MSGFPDVRDVLPHAGRAVMLSRIVEHVEDRTVCLVEVGEDLVPVWIGLEYMAQCVAAHAGLRALARREPVKVGLFIGSRRVDFRAAGFRRGQRLLVSATRVWGEREFGAFACALRDEGRAQPLAEGTLTVALPESLDALGARVST